MSCHNQSVQSIRKITFITDGFSDFLPILTNPSYEMKAKDFPLNTGAIGEHVFFLFSPVLID